ncbi:MAG TPA: ABC transporter permease [Bryobacteraceae bacterium]|nr:ABC transporter permease [Bryobacteraceae bacterium]
MHPTVICRFLIRAASWIVPARARAVWRQKWDSMLDNAWILLERGELDRTGREWLASCCWAGFHDALRTRLPLFRSPGFLLTAALVALGVLGVVTQGYRGTRALFERLPIEDPGSLVALRYTGSVGQPAGVPPRLIPIWAAKATLISGIAGFLRRPYSPHGRVTPNFFALLGARPAQGRLFQPADRDTAVVSDWTWRNTFHADPRILGRRITVDSQDYTVVGVLPDTFWAISPQIGVWTPFHLEPKPDPDLPFLVGAIVRLKPGTTWPALRGDLFRTARSANQLIPRAPETWWAPLPSSQLPSYLLGIAFAIAVGAFLVARQQTVGLHHSWRYWRFLASKTLLLMLIPSLVWIECTRFVPIPARPLVTLLFLAACAFAFWWSFADQRRRCPVCFKWLGLPVTLGSWSSVLEPVTTEFLCESGHGALCVPETEQGERDRWTNLDSSWRDFFHKVT